MITEVIKNPRALPQVRNDLAQDPVAELQSQEAALSGALSDSVPGRLPNKSSALVSVTGNADVLHDEHGLSIDQLFRTAS
ncbi:hypothetical protein DYI20_04705 [Auritidibacter ignavus]|uniref:Uncharacterized protein n=1 Tax=Auritidibacter ignavus TaxID=678932 RepID=A0AAJ6AMG8_9MICC|nr:MULTISPECIES: hypothetical protein [Auritidibacter]AXR74480.1 hypothetical protein DCC27_009455 [Auritidibacter sp. NML130574]PXA80688.1 hypothetical protein DCC25_05590 [Auritidibacter sp. NML120636]PXA76485.1 hypothetical protein DCC24_06830 [Auritidibacter sp. NML100628]RMX23382.1 hypothetical protein DYI20_04705 [Auritidibacter ignavus]WGH81001.1 hypothetical protein QDX25_09405 [Auritidibacter ignavus]